MFTKIYIDIGWAFELLQTEESESLKEVVANCWVTSETTRGGADGTTNAEDEADEAVRRGEGSSIADCGRWGVAYGRGTIGGVMYWGK